MPEPSEKTRAYNRDYASKHKDHLNGKKVTWAKANPDKVKAAARKWTAKTPVQRRASKLKARYGMTIADFDAMMNRQRHRCLGCQNPLLEGAIDIDHDHETGAVRGILCHGCNVALGFIKDDVGTLHRLAAYLHREPSKMMVYVVGSLRNPTVLQIGDALRAQGYDAFDNWMSAGEHADDAWRDYEKGRGRTYAEALKGRSARHVFNFDRAHLDMSDAAILVMPGGKSAHLELGYMGGRGKPTYILTDGEPERFDVMSQFAPMVTHDLWAIILDLEEKRAALGLGK